MRTPNVLLIVMDSVRASNTTIHGHHHDTTPFLAEFSERATNYTQARAPSQWSLPSHTSLFTGFHVAEHGVTSDQESIKPGTTVFDDLQEQGYETGLFSDNPYLTSLDTGLDSGFSTVEGGVREPPFEGVNPDEYKGEILTFLKDAVRSGHPLRSLANGITAKIAWDYPDLLPASVQRELSSGNTPGAAYTDLFSRWLDDTTGPWAACINYMDAHHPYSAREEFDNWDDGTIESVQDSITEMPLGFYTGEDSWWRCELLEYLYDGTIRQVDHEIERVIRFLEERDELDDTLVVVTSDHGEGFGEQSNLRDVRIAGHNVGEHEVNLHVPLLVKHPGSDQGSNDHRPVSLTAIPELLRRTALDDDSDSFDLASLPVLARTQGLRQIQRDQLLEKGVDVDSFTGEADILYERRDEYVMKWTSWSGQKETTAYVDAQTAFSVPERDGDRLDAVVSDLDEARVKQENDNRTVEAETKRRLEDLGYR